MEIPSSIIPPSTHRTYFYRLAADLDYPHQAPGNRRLET